MTMAEGILKLLPYGVFALLVKVGGLYLHHNFVVALLSDLFGIQCRGGCMRAGGRDVGDGSHAFGGHCVRSTGMVSLPYQLAVMVGALSLAASR